MPLPIRRAKGPAGPTQVVPRSRGALLGLATGNALGITNKNRRLFAPMFPALADAPLVDMRGLILSEIVPGQVTGPTQMATALANSYHELTTFSPDDVRKRYVQWLEFAFDVSDYVKEVLTTTPAHQASRLVWNQASRRAADNGSLARSTATAVFMSNNDDDRLRIALEECAITHFDPRCQLACAAFTHAIAACINARAEPKTVDIMLAAETGIAIGSSKLAKMIPDVVQDIHHAADMLRADLVAAKDADPLLYGPDLHMHNQPSFVRTTFRLAFWELLHTTTFEAGVVDVVNRGGDTDTNGAVTGALLGAFYGEAAIPERWRDPVLTALERKAGPLRDRYHPNQLLQWVPAA